MDTKEKDLIAELNTLSAQQQRDWFRGNPEEACHLFWWLLGYSHLDTKAERTRKGNEGVEDVVL